MKTRPILVIPLVILIGLLLFAGSIILLNMGSNGNRVPQTPTALRSSVVWVETVPAVDAPMPSEPWIKDLFVKEGEIPAGWRTEGSTWDGKSLDVAYRTEPRQTGVSLGQSIVFYSTTLLAEQDYSSTLDRYFPPEYIKDWKDVPELDLPYRADSMKVACLASNLDGIPLQACRSIARYKRLIVMTFGTVYEDKLTMAGYRQMLESVDQRVSEVLSQHP